MLFMEEYMSGVVSVSLFHVLREKVICAEAPLRASAQRLNINCCPLRKASPTSAPSPL